MFDVPLAYPSIRFFWCYRPLAHSLSITPPPAAAKEILASWEIPVYLESMTHHLLALSMPGGPELIFILVIVLLLFGAKKLPELARGLGQSLGEFKKAREEFEREIHKSAADVEVKPAPAKELYAGSPAVGEVPGTTGKEPAKTA